METIVLWRESPPYSESPAHPFGQGVKGTSPTSSLEGVFSWRYHSESLEMGTLKVGERLTVAKWGLTVPPWPLLSWQWGSGGHC